VYEPVKEDVQQRLGGKKNSGQRNREETIMYNSKRVDGKDPPPLPLISVIYI
jgi:hypothetical protein